MYITSIVPVKGKRYKIFNEDNFLFALYEKELKQYHITEQTELDDQFVKDILQNVVYKRARERALYLLEHRPLSVAMLREKLLANDYPDCVITQVIDFLKNYHYLDDVQYIRSYVSAYANKKSKKQIVCDLLKKGISKALIDSYFTEEDYSERECFYKQFERYIRGKDLEDRIVQQKIFRYFYGKGFQSCIIEEALKKISEC